MSDNYGDIEDEIFAPLPPPHSPDQGGQDEGNPFGDEDGEDGDVSKLAEVPAAKRKGVKRPQPKLDSNRLISERGLPALRTLFNDVRFKGKGHEAEDLRLLMQKMQNWAHRLYPKLQFEDFIDKVERLGKKKEVQTCLKRIRLDMPLTHEDYTSQDVEDEAAPEPHVFADPDPFNEAVFPSELPVHSTPAPVTPSMTAEQQRRMELNRQRALEKKLARQQQLRDSQTDDSSTNLLIKAEAQAVQVEEFEPQPSSSSSNNTQQQQRRQLPRTDSEAEEEEENSLS